MLLLKASWPELFHTSFICSMLGCLFRACSCLLSNFLTIRLLLITISLMKVLGKFSFYYYPFFLGYFCLKKNPTVTRYLLSIRLRWGVCCVSSGCDVIYLFWPSFYRYFILSLGCFVLLDSITFVYHCNILYLVCLYWQSLLDYLN